ncbi:MAG: YihA family ribosome biogenesis GTP-binding protein [Deltaproteobacteria bacterium]|nr:YihA family ribosome biogenesis GTP-binding protein [Deltaproteobacteria bacterium]MBW2015561.1 YihA family ribosome biogenesis GTP-binding protein [Deltaproteobacteria bacterium]MBW2127881.1 YihA family ribosome biogenesis GTP-binding protein [Deltaproteobacteria bacterium]MBW2302867.1 YihA family ribosome biogenesis GTP-binding protein [Deltaproteobacteria bacterium]
MRVEFLKSAFREEHYPPPDRPEVAFAGRSNVGKSSLLNVLVNRRKLARTSSTPGRTRALNFFNVENRLYLVDLPGYGYARVPLRVKASWREMVETYLRGRENLRAVVLILDIRRDPGQEEIQLLQWLDHYRIPSILVLTKADKISRNQAAGRASKVGSALKGLISSHPVIFSARTKEGRGDLGERINRLTNLDLFRDHKL